MQNQFSRTAIIIGKENIEKLNKSKVAIFGIGGVGSFVCEGLVRAGVQNFVLVDNDTISVTNINRQLHANHNTIGKYKVDVMKERMLEINPNCKIEVYKKFFMPKEKGNLESDSNVDSSKSGMTEEDKLDVEAEIIDNSIDYIVDAVDTVTAKIELVMQADKLNIPIISSMGTGNKLDPTKFEVTDIYKTSVCPLAKVMRKELKSRNINKLKVVYSKEEPIMPHIDDSYNEEIANATKQYVPGSISFVPSVAGLIIAGEVVKDLIK